MCLCICVYANACVDACVDAKSNQHVKSNQNAMFYLFSEKPEKTAKYENSVD